MEEKFFNKELCKRFVSETNLEIPVLNNKEVFFYYLDLYEDKFGSRTKYNNLINEIDKNYDGDVSKFLDSFYQIRDNMIKDILGHERYNEFISNTTFDKYKTIYSTQELSSLPKGNVYNEENLGKVFLSIDLKKGNFQSMKYFSKELVKGADTYEDYVKNYTDSEYVANSKYNRQVVFGKCNAARQILIEKYLMSKFYENFRYNKSVLKLSRFNTDELVFEIVDSSFFKLDFNYRQKVFFCSLINQEIETAMSLSGVDVSYKYYMLQGISLTSKRTGKERNMMYVLKNICLEGLYEFKCVPEAYHAIVYKLYNKIPLEKNDYYFNYEGIDAIIDDEFTLNIYNSPKSSNRHD